MSLEATKAEDFFNEGVSKLLRFFLFELPIDTALAYHITE